LRKKTNLEPLVSSFLVAKLAVEKLWCDFGGVVDFRYQDMMIWWWYDDDMMMIWWWYADDMMMILW